MEMQKVIQYLLFIAICKFTGVFRVWNYLNHIHRV